MFLYQKVLLWCCGVMTAVSSYGQCTLTWYYDGDLDGFGLGSVSISQPCNVPGPAGYVSNNLDCNDQSANLKRWSIIGDVPASSSVSTGAEVAIGSDMKPVVLYRNYTPNVDLAPFTVKRFDGSGWQTLGTDPLENYMYSAHLRLDASNTPYVVFKDFDPLDNTNNKATMLRYNGSAWVTVGSRRFSSQIVNADGGANLAFDAAQQPVVALVNTNGDVEVMRFDGTAWVNVGTTGRKTIFLFEASIDIDASGKIYVAFSDDNGLLSVITYDGAQWVDVGPPSLSTDFIDFPMVRVDATGIPYVSYYDYTEGVVVQRFNSTLGSWEKLSAVVADMPASLTLAINRDNIPHVAYAGGGAQNISVAKWNGTTWTVVPTDAAISGIRVSLAIGHDDDMPYVAYNDLTSSDQAVVRTLKPKTVLPVTPTLQTTPTTICAGGTTTMKISTGSLGDGTQWQWYTGSCGTTLVGSGSSLIVSPATTTTYYARAEGTCLTSPGTCVPVSVTVNANPSIDTQPLSQAVCIGKNTALSVNAIGSGTLSYQWLVDKKDGAGMNPLSGETTSVLALTNVPASNNTFDYQVRVTQSTGSCQSLSNKATLTVNPLPAITTQPTAATVCAGGDLTLQVLASGSPLTYQWYVDAGSGEVLVSGETNATLGINTIPKSSDGYRYRVDVINSTTGCSQLSNAAQLTVHDAPVFQSQPVDLSLCLDGSGTFQSTVVASPVSYQWQVDEGTSTWQQVSGATTTALLVDQVPVSWNGRLYRLQANVPGCPAAYSKPVLLTVTSPPVFNGPADVSVCAGGDAVFVVDDQSSWTYQWQQWSGTAWSDVTSANVYQLELDNITTTMDQSRYRVMVTSPVCPAVTSSEARLTVISAPAFILQPVSISACPGDDVRFEADAGNSVSYQWEINNGGGWDDISGETQPSLLLSSVTSAMAAPLYRVTIEAPGCTDVSSAEVQLTLRDNCDVSLLISEGVSPNGDGQLDHWVIQGIEQFPGNSVQVYNVWGDLVFKTTSYNNQERMWYGQSLKSFAGGNTAPDGTYYYIIDLGNQSPAIRGFVVLRR